MLRSTIVVQSKGVTAAKTGLISAAGEHVSFFMDVDACIVNTEEVEGHDSVQLSKESQGEGL